jgi:hypothetical protein
MPQSQLLAACLSCSGVAAGVHAGALDAALGLCHYYVHWMTAFGAAASTEDAWNRLAVLVYVGFRGANVQCSRGSLVCRLCAWRCREWPLAKVATRLAD